MKSLKIDYVFLQDKITVYFDKLDSVTKHKLFRTYCSSMYGCELLSLDEIMRAE